MTHLPGGPPGGRKPKPPSQTAGAITLVFAPTVVEAINGVTAALKPQPPPPDYTELITALINAIRLHTSIVTDQTAAIRDHASAIRANTDALVINNGIQAGNIDTISRLTNVLSDLVTAVEDLTEAVDDLTPTPPAPAKATGVSLTARAEPLARTGESMATFDATTLPPIQCVPLQLYPDTQGFGITFTFNGSVDGEPTIICQGGFTGITQDPKVEQPSADPNDPQGNIETLCTIHGKATQPADAPGTKVDFSVNWDADVAGTEDIEKYVQVFEDAIEWIAPSAPKASRVSLVAVVEPLEPA